MPFPFISYIQYHLRFTSARGDAPLGALTAAPSDEEENDIFLAGGNSAQPAFDSDAISVSALLKSKRDVEEKEEKHKRKSNGLLQAIENKKKELTEQNAHIEQLEASNADLQEQLTAALGDKQSLIDEGDQHLLVRQIRTLQEEVRAAAWQRANDIRVLEQRQQEVLRQQQLRQQFNAREQFQLLHELRAVTRRSDAAECIVDELNAKM